MYRYIRCRLTPDDLEAIAAQLYVEMLKSGYTAVGEFQYLHHGKDGGAFDNPAEMSLRALAAAQTTGIGATCCRCFISMLGSANSRRATVSVVLSTEQICRKIYEILAKATRPRLRPAYRYRATQSKGHRRIDPHRGLRNRCVRTHPHSHRGAGERSR